MLHSLVGEAPKEWDLKLPQAEFAFNYMVNRSSGKTPFSIVFTKTPNHTTDLLHLPSPTNCATENFAHRVTKTIEEVRASLQNSNTKYKAAVDAHRKFKSFNVGDLVMVHLSRDRFPVSEYSKLKPKKYGPFRILTKINDNSYIIALPND